MHELFYTRYMGLRTYHKAAHVIELCGVEGASENLVKTCSVLFGSSLLNSVSSFVLLLDSVPTPMAYQSYSVNQGLFAVIFLIFIL